MKNTKTRRARKKVHTFHPDQQIHQWTVIADNDDRDARGKRLIQCRCSCGTEKLVRAGQLVNGESHRCRACASRRYSNKRARKFRPGEKIAHFTVIEELTERDHGARLIRCLCDCGTEHVARAHQLNHGVVTACRLCAIRQAAKVRSKKYCGDRHHGWKGGRQTKTDGYILVKCPDHPNAQSKGYILEHRLVMEQQLGRYLDPNETVHHKNGIRGDNRPENLELRIGQHGIGQTVEDRIEDAINVLRRYAPEQLREESTWAICA